MSKETADLILACLGITLGLCTLLGLFARFVALPWLRDHLVTPVKETNHQVTVNQHVSPSPTLLDKVDTLKSDVRTASRMFEGHIDRSAAEWGRLWTAIHQLEDRFAERNDP